MSWLLLAALSALFLGLYDVSKKSAVDHNAVLPVLFTSSLAGVVLLVPVGLLSVLDPALAARLGIRLLPMGSLGHGLIAIKAGIVTLSWVLTFFGIKHLPISLASPIRASAPLFTVLGAILLLGESPTWLQLLGIVTILVSYLSFSLIGRKEGIVFERNRWVWMLFAGTLVGAVSGLYDKHLLQSAGLAPMSVQFYFTLYNALIQGALVMFFWWPTRAQTTPFRFRGSIVLVALLLLLADSVYFRALSMPGALISVVSAVRRSNVVISFSVGGLLFRERQRGPKAIALVFVLVGLLLLLK
ncbi:MAG: DMT family transporter [Polyangiaceae bacterium]